MKIRPFAIALVVIALVLSACGMIPVTPTATATAVPPTYTLQPTYTPMPTYTPYPSPTPVPPTPTPAVVAVSAQEIESILTANGYAPDTSGSSPCNNKCDIFFNSNISSLAGVYPNGHTIFVFFAHSDGTVTKQMGVMFQKIYGPEMADWSTSHETETLNQPQSATINGYSIEMTYLPAADSSSSPSILVEILPPNNG